MKQSKRYGPYGGRYVPEMLIPLLDQLSSEFSKAKLDNAFNAELGELYKTYSGRPTPLTYAKRLTKKLGGAQIYLKNEGINHTGAHKINHCLGQVLIAKRMGKKRIIAETGAGQHGVATATVAAKFGIDCTIYMGAKDITRQRPNVFYMEQLGAKVVSVNEGSQTLKDAVSAAIRDLLTNPDDTHYLIGSVLGPAPYPEMNAFFQSVIGREVKEDILKRTGRLPSVVVACVGGGSNAIGIFGTFLAEKSVKCIGIEAGGHGKRLGQHASRFRQSKIGVLHGYKSYLLQTKQGNIASTSSVAAGLDYPGIGPELAQLYDQKRVSFSTATDQEAIEAFKLLAKTEGILPALESAHAVAEAVKLAPNMPRSDILVINISGRGDKDIFNLARALKDKPFHAFLAEEASHDY